MSLNFNVLVETEASLGSVAETVLGPGPVLDSSTGAYRGRLGDHVELSVSESRPHRCGTGALLFEFDIVVLRWSDGQLVVNDSEFKDTALAVVGSAALVGRIPWV